jgi:hypothetical protein
MPRERVRPPGRKAPRVAVRKAATLLEFSPELREIPGVMKRRLPIR